jgi:glycerate-2-kinase
MISNRFELIENSEKDLFRKFRSNACDILEAALEAVDPEKAIYNALKLEGELLRFEGGSIDLSTIKRIYVIGGGKAGGLMGKAVERLLGNRISSGVVNVLEGTEKNISLKHICLNSASHPVPSLNGVEGVQRMLKLTRDLVETDLVITLISGGGSALMPLPAEGVCLKDLQHITNQLLFSGATINELNAVRKHLSAFKGGQFARHCYPACIISLILSDVIDDPVDVIASGPTAPDTSTFSDALEVLKKYNLMKVVPESIKSRLENGAEGKISDTPKKDDPIFQRVHNILIANNFMASNKAKEKAEELGYTAVIFSTNIEGEARKVGKKIATIANEIIKEPSVEKPTAVIFGGETTVTVKGQGKGGRNQELALATSMKIDGISCLVATLGTDGIDGPTEAAGAIVDGNTYRRAKKKGLEPEKYLSENDSYNFFNILGDLIITGPTGTNVNDLALILVS